MSLRISSVLLTLALVGAACAAPAADVSNEIPFAAGSYPVAGDAPCITDDNGAPLPGLARIDAPKENQVIFTLCAPDPTFIEKLALVSLGINDSGYLAAATADGSILTKPNGTGPLQLINWSKENEQILLGRFENYWGTKSVSGEVVFKWQPDSAARFLALEAGTIDGMDNLSTDDIVRLKGDARFQIFSRAPLNTLYAGMNANFAPFDDVRVRRAVAMTIDRARLVKHFFPEGSEAGTHYVPCMIRYGCEGPSWYEVDLPAARALLAEAGYPDGFTTRIAYRDAVRVSNPDPTGIATDIQAQLAEIGIDVTLEVQEPATFNTNVLSGKQAGIFIRGWIPDFMDPTNYMTMTFVTEYQKFGPLVEELAAPIRAAATIQNSPERAALFAEANAALKDAAIMVPLGHGTSAVAWAAGVNGAHASSTFNEELSLVSIPGRELVVFAGTIEPPSLYCADETENNTLRICSQINQGLYSIASNDTTPIPSLATLCTSSANLKVWTCDLREGVQFHNGASFDAGDVRDSFAAMWDCANPSHVGSSGLFRYWGFMSSFLNEEVCSGGG